MRTFTSNDCITGKLNNQYTLTGLNPSFIEEGSTFFLEYVEYTGDITIKDGKGKTKTGTLSSGLLDLGHSPLRLEDGIEIIGTVEFVKFFIIGG